ncbi:MAG: hypothetical protein JWM11_6784 [Planctomycetaceae bacterium]|nr:hypothetical protein [Planctomycetaceae bacterium]
MHAVISTEGEEFRPPFQVLRIAHSRNNNFLRHWEVRIERLSCRWPACGIVKVLIWPAARLRIVFLHRTPASHF